MSAQTLSMVSGNGQMIATQSLSANPMVVQARDASGRLAPNVAITWSITNGAGTISGASATTDANGQASANFLSTSLQPGASFLPSTVTATSAFGTVNFIITTVVSSALQPIVSIELVAPSLDNPNLTGASGSTIPAGVVVKVIVAGGAYSGTPIPNVGVQIIDATNPSQPAAASCAAPTGAVLTNSAGVATCDLAITGSPDSVELRAYVGGIQYTRPFGLTITPGQNCRFSLSSSSQSFTGSGGVGSVNVSTTSGCGWSAASNANFIAITSATSGLGNGTVSYSVAPNSGAGRAGTLTIAGQTYTVNQTGAGTSGSLTIPAQTLPHGAISTSYHTTLTAAGGTPPYTWSPAGPIGTSGLSLLASGDINGSPNAPGVITFVATVADNAGARQAQSFSITIDGSGGGSSGFTISNTTFPSGTAGQAYPPQVLLAQGGCVTPFSPQPGFSVSQGALPDGLSIQTNSDGSHSITGTPSNPGTFRFTLQATDACGKSATASFSILITGTAAAPMMIVSPESLTFTVQYGAANAPGDQSITVNSTGASLGYSAAVLNPAGGNWLVAKSTPNGNTPGSFVVGIANFGNLAPGDYAGSVTFTSEASNSPVTVPVKLTVLPSAPLTVSPGSFTINQMAGSTTLARQDINLASGTSSLQFTTVATTNRGGQWLAVSTSQGSTPTTVTAIINSGGLAPGQYAGTITILPASGVAQTVNVILNVLAPVTLSATPAPLAFTYELNGSLPASQAVTVNSSGAALSISASAATQTGGSWLQVSPQNGATSMNLSVSVSPIGLAPGNYSGVISITSDPGVLPLTIPVTLVVKQSGPVITSATNAASYAPGPVAPGEVITIFGLNLGPATLASLHVTDSGTVDTNLGGTQVFFDGYPAPLLYTSATAVSAIVPYEIAGGNTTSVLVIYQGTRSNYMTVPVLDSLPGIFTIDASGYGQGAILNQDTSVNSSQNGAAPGSIVSIYATGAGVTDPASVDGAITGSVLPIPQLRVKVQIAGEAAEVLYAGAAPGEPSGVLQVNARIPADVPRGSSVPVVITVGNASSQAGVTVAIKP